MHIKWPMNLIIGILFSIVSMLGFGLVDYLVGGFSKQIGAFNTSFWNLVARIIILMIAAPFLLSGFSLTPYLVILLVLAAVSQSIGALGLAKGMRVGSISVISPITATYPVVTIFLALFFLNQAITTLQWLCILVIIAGTLLVSINLKNMLKADSKKLHLGIEFALASAIGWGFFFFFMTLLTQAIGWFPSLLLVIIPQFVIYLAYGYLAKEDFKVKLAWAPRFLVMGLLALIGFIGYNLGVTYTYTAIVAPISAASIIITIFLAMLFFKEKLELYQKIGMLMVIIGVIATSVF